MPSTVDRALSDARSGRVLPLSWRVPDGRTITVRATEEFTVSVQREHVTPAETTALRQLAVELIETDGTVQPLHGYRTTSITDELDLLHRWDDRRGLLLLTVTRPQ